MSSKMKMLNVLFAMIALLLAGCSTKEAMGEEKPEPEEVHHDFLLYKQEYVDEDERSIGDLYIKSDNKQKEKISSRVVDGQFEYMNSSEKVLFINEESELYVYEKGKEKSKVAKDVASFRGYPELDMITFQDEEGDLYITQKNGEKEKIASSVTQYDIMDGSILYVDDDGDFSKYHIKDKSEVELANDIVFFKNLNGKDEVAYLNDDYALYFRNIEDEESIKISSEEVYGDSIKKIGDQLVYFSTENEESGELFTAKIEEGTSPVKIASDIVDYKYHDDYFYYVNNDDNLYMKKADDQDSKKLASDVSNFKQKNDTLYYQDTENTLYKIEGNKEPKKISEEVLSFYITPDSDVVYETEDEELFVNEKKVASDVQDYVHYFGNVAFSTKDDQLFLMKEMDEKQAIKEDLNDISSAYYQNSVIFSNELSFEDISGIWKADGEDGPMFVEIDKEGAMKYLFSDDVRNFNVDYAGYGYLSASYDESSYRFELDGDTLNYSDEGFDLSFTKSSKQEAEEYYKKVQLEADKEEISTLLDRYLNDFEDAVYYGEMYYIEDYIDGNAPLFKQQEDFIASAYEKNIIENLVDYNIDSIESVDKDSYTVKVSETFSIYVDGEENEKSFHNTYTVKRINDEFLITDLKVGTDSSL
ncbi:MULTISPECIES: DUF5050 domain-containing protein [unclassified Bacillus (in: firmicutes)]|uniref:TcaA NTF2-like domain-containing protein n=1 Tax=unclassified Bacillus (in: firmicutes) TaxID=185979 RepID=UPI0008ED6839|nr:MULTISPECIES: DUF5050 domain-containing protein [unclassified Bacillus (in: firmicutes)]SFB20770.1 hypothetical protein SAMN02799634_108129 [Bacillus sp. UNCCL13]SFQ90905.1 hypothetical protein SAMN04488577_3944 [Bacillus sp. cl95]